MDRDDPLIGRKLANYRVERLLKRGGMASVYYGWDIQLERPVAIKLVDTRYRDKPGYAERFLREARAISTWHHENILQIYYADNESGLYYYVMEYIRGLDLSQLLSQYAKENVLIPLKDVARIGWACASALDYAHQKGVIHRDVKPSNLLLSEEGRVVLGDFGIAMDISQGTLGKVFGSPQYIAPEQARNSADAVSQSDLYALGVILYEMLTGRLPFNDPSPTSLALQHITQDPPAPRIINPALSREVEDVLLKTLQKLPDERFQSGAEMMNALEQALKTYETIKAVPDSTDIGDALPRSYKALSRISLAERVADYVQAQSPFPEDAPLDEQQEKHILLDKFGPMAWWGAGCGTLLVLGVLLVILGNTFIFDNELPGLTPLGRTSSPQQITALPSLPPTAMALATQNMPANVSTTQTERPTNTPNIQFTASASPTAGATSPSLPTQTSPPAPTGTSIPPQPTRSGDNLFAMYYDDRSFYIKNLSGKDRSVFPFAFERIDDSGNFINRFEGWHWGNIYSRFRADFCLVLEILNYTDHMEPDECNNRHLVMHYPPLSRDYLFWIEDGNSKEFRVLWDNQEVGRCKIKKGSCEVYLP
jgi:serine/threonine protein kinase